MFVIPKDIASCLKQLNLPKGPIVVGVSGGADSLYLTYLLQQWTKQNHRPLFAVTINHNLRSESQQEAKWVHQQLTRHKIHHTILEWKGTKPKTHIEECAREERYRLLIDFCHKNKAHILFLAHHQQDQAETFWARLARGSGLDGLSSMSLITQRSDIMIVRPLLNTTKDTIVHALKAKHLRWAEDCMNQDPTYERVRWRQAQPQLDKLGLTATYVAKSTERLQRAKKALDFYTHTFLNQHLQKSAYGFVSIDEKSFTDLPLEIRVRVVMQIFNIFNYKNKLISLDSVEKIAFTIPKHATLAGCQWVISHHKIFVAPELKTLAKTMPKCNQWIKWGGCQILTNKPFEFCCTAPTPRHKNIPFLIQRTFLKIPTGYHIIQSAAEKELEKKKNLDYKDNTPFVIIRFNERKDEI